MAWGPNTATKPTVRDLSDPERAAIAKLKAEIQAKWPVQEVVSGAVPLVQRLETLHPNRPDNIKLCYDTLMKCPNSKEVVTMAFSLMRLYEGMTEDDFAGNVGWMNWAMENTNNVGTFLSLVTAKYANMNERANMINTFIVTSHDSKSTVQVDAIATLILEGLNRDIEGFGKVIGSVKVSLPDMLNIEAQYKESRRLPNILNDFITLSMRLDNAPEMNAALVRFIHEYNDHLFMSRYLEQLVWLCDSFGKSYLIRVLDYLNSEWMMTQLQEHGYMAYWMMVDQYMMDNETVKALSETRRMMQKERRNYPYYPANHFQELYNTLAEVYNKPLIQLRK